MIRRLFQNLQFRLLAIVLLVAIPMTGLLLYNATEQRSQAISDAEDNAVRLVHLAATEYDRLIDGTHQLLIVLSHLPEVRQRDTAACSALLGDLLPRYSQYTNLVAIGPDGIVFCSGLPSGVGASALDRPAFWHALETSDFSVGEYQIGRVTGKPSMPFYYPVLDESGAVQVVVYAALDLGWLDRFAAGLRLPAGSVLTLIDRDGTILARSADAEQWAGQPMVESVVRAALLQQDRDNAIEGYGVDGVWRQHTIVPLRGLPGEEPDMFMVVSTSVATLFAPANWALARALMVVGVLTLLALVASWAIGQALILRPATALVGAARRLSAGDLSARSGLREVHGELSQLAHAFDEMAASLQQREALLRESEARYRVLVEHNPAVIYTTGLGDSGIASFISPQVEQMVGYSAAEWVAAHLWSSVIHPDDRDRVLAEMERCEAGGEAVDVEYRLLARDGRIVWVHDVAELVRAAEGQPAFLQGVMLDITERKQAEEQYQSAIQTAMDGSWLIDTDGRFLDVSDTYCELTGYRRDELLAMMVADIEAVETAEDIAAHIRRITENGRDRFETRHRRKDGRLRDVDVSAHYINVEGGRIFAFVRDITERKQTQEQLELQFRRLEALRNIDRAISGSLDLRVTLAVLLEQVVTHLRVDAADALLFNPHNSTLEYAAGRGFRTRGIERSRVHLGEGYTGRIAYERRLVSVPNLPESGIEFERAALLADEGFVGYCGAPLVAKGQIVGVLEVFQRSPLDPDADWLEFLEAMAGQAAIAIDNATLVADVQRSNVDLRLAYDATIEGWSRALDMRDKETEGHSQRVTEMTVRLGRAMGLSEADLTYARWGALLHDIGKMGIPDNILLKPEPLTDDEWVVMRRHPVYAYEMLSAIGYLRPSIDIPYCHHERWDGAGYPRGLRGEQIPLAVRVFTLADAWDALRSDRPYRPAWTEEAAHDYIREQAGQLYDPEVVAAFLSLDLTA